MSDAPITAKFQAQAPAIMRQIMAAITPRLSAEDAAAVLGSFGTETGGFEYREEVGGSGGFGWAMWTGTRRDDMEQWCGENGYEPYHPDEDEYDLACLSFFIHEITETWEKRVLTEGGSIDGVFYPPLCQCPTLDAKTESFWRLYERPGAPHEDWRREMAAEALRLYRGEQEGIMVYPRIAMSSGHSAKCRGAAGVLDEVNEARRIVERLADELRDRGVDVATFNDDVSTSQNENLNRIVDWHNARERDLDISVHLNAYVETTKPMGCEVLYVTQSELASRLSAAIASCGFLDRGGKYRSDLFFLNSTSRPSVLLEICFVDSEADADIYADQFDAICAALADTLGGELEEEVPEPPPEGGGRPERPVAPPRPVLIGRVEIDVSGPVSVVVNRVPWVR